MSMGILKRFGFALLYWSGIWLLFRYLNRRKFVILMYHGVTDKEIVNWTQVPVHEFRKQMKYISRRCHPVALERAAGFPGKDSAEHNYSIVVTFDDGFKNNYTCAYPIMKTYNIASTVFLTTSFVDKDPRYGGILWTDYISSILQSTAKNNLDLTDFGLGRIDLSDSLKRYHAKGRICFELKKLDYGEKNRIIEEIGRRLESGVSEYDYGIFQSLDWDDVDRLSGGGLMEFGAHTVNHEILPGLPRDIMEREILDSKRIVENHTTKPVTAFAYPNGSFNNEVKDRVSSHFDCALTSIEGLNHAGIDRYELKRFNIFNGMKMWEFKLAISGTMELVGKFGRFFRRSSYYEVE